jgi:hypothetical protein
MSEPDQEMTGALAALRTAVREALSAPPAAAVRARAERRLRTRRLTAAVAAVVLAGAAAVAVIAVRTTATPTVPTAATTLSSPPVWAPDVTTPAPPSPRPNLEVPSYPLDTVDDPIARVDWANVTLSLPARAACPSGPLRFRRGVTAGYPRMWLITKASDGRGGPVYGDLTGDGRTDAVIETACRGGPQSDHTRDQLLVVDRDPIGRLHALGWVGPVGFGVVADFWLEGGRIVIDPTADSESRFSIGQTLVYQRRDGRFATLDGSPGIQPGGPDRPGAPIDLGPSDGYVAQTLRSPGGIVRITGPEYATVARGDGAVYSFTDNLPGLPHLFDLSGDGRRFLLVAVRSLDPQTYEAGAGEKPEDVLGQGVLVLDRTAGGFRAVDLVPSPPGFTFGSWVFERGRLTIEYFDADGEAAPSDRWIWNGQYFQRAR